MIPLSFITSRDDCHEHFMHLTEIKISMFRVMTDVDFCLFLSFSVYVVENYLYCRVSALSWYFCSPELWWLITDPADNCQFSSYQNKRFKSAQFITMKSQWIILICLWNILLYYESQWIILLWIVFSTEWKSLSSWK